MSNDTENAIHIELHKFLRLADEPSGKVLLWLLAEYGGLDQIASFVDLLAMAHGKFCEEFAIEIRSALETERRILRDNYQEDWTVALENAQWGRA